MKKRISLLNNKILVLMLLLVTTVLVCATSYQLFKYKCFWWDCAPHRKFTVYNLNLSGEFFPPGTEIPVLYPDHGIITAVDEARGASNWRGGGAVYIVDRFGTERQALQWFESRSRQNLFTSPIEEQSQYSLVLDYISAVADSYKVNCGYVVSRISCMFEARYHEFYIFFNCYLSENGMTQEDFLDVMIFIDNRMQELLK